jgi:hypothetical protein
MIYGASMGLEGGAVVSLKGDLNGDGAVTTAYAVLALRVMAGMQPATRRSDYATSGADASGDAKIGMPNCSISCKKWRGRGKGRRRLQTVFTVFHNSHFCGLVGVANDRHISSFPWSLLRITEGKLQRKRICRESLFQ